MTPEEVLGTVEEFARKNNLLLKRDAHMVTVLKGLVRKDMHCPCRVDPVPCPCKECISDTVEYGGCHCGLFWRRV